MTKVAISGYGNRIRETPNGKITGIIPIEGVIANAISQPVDNWVQYDIGFIHVDAHDAIKINQSALPLKWVSQLGTNADKYGADCGAAAAAMILELYNEEHPLVDEIATGFGFSRTKIFGTLFDVSKALTKYGVPSDVQVQFDVFKQIVSLDALKPFIQLLDYPVLPLDKQYDKSYKAGHFVVVYGYDNFGVYVSDPYSREELQYQISWDKWLEIIASQRYNQPAQVIVPREGLALSKMIKGLTRRAKETFNVL